MHQNRQRRHKRRARHRGAAGIARLAQPIDVHVRCVPREPQPDPFGIAANIANQADRIEQVAIEIKDHEIRALLAERRHHFVPLPRENDLTSGVAGSRAEFRCEEQIVDDRQDHDKIIPDMLIRTAAVPPFFKNGYLVVCETTKQAVLIDPGDEVDALLDEAKEMDATIVAILLTHAHLDHVTGVARAKSVTEAPVWLHRDDLFLYNGVVEQGQMFGLRVSPQPSIDKFFADGRALTFGNYVIDVHHTPGHCPGGVCLAIGPANSAERHLFVGDTLFAGSIGRTDLPGGDMDTLLKSIRTVLFGFPDDAQVLSGHGPVTTVGEEKKSNPFLTP